MPAPDDPTARNALFFTFDPAVEGKRVDYFGGNLATAVQPVPAARREIAVYRNLRLTAPALLAAGLAAIAGTTAYQMYRRDRYKSSASDLPDFTGVLVGIGLCLSSAIPEICSKGRIEKAVELYNAGATDSTVQAK